MIARSDLKGSAEPSALSARLCQAVREEVRLCSILGGPWEPMRSPLIDVEAEQDVLVAMTCDILPPPWLEPAHFFQRFHAMLFILWSRWLERGRRFEEDFEGRIDETIEVVRRLRLGTPLVERAVAQIAYGSPCALPMQIIAARVVRAAALRQARAACHRLDAVLSLDDGDAGRYSALFADIGAALEKAEQAASHDR